MALTVDDARAFQNLSHTMQTTTGDELLNLYYEGQQRLEHIGIAVPPELRKFETVVNWPRLYVDALLARISLKSLLMPGIQVPDAVLHEGWEINNLDSEFKLTVLDQFVYGRGFMCVGANEDDAEHPLITVESPRELAATIDPRTRRVASALRLYGSDPGDPATPRLATLYLPASTTWLELGSDGRWQVADRDEHGLGVVPVVPFINRRRSGHWRGVSQMADVIPLTDAAARSLTNLQIAGETHSVPQKYVLGMSKGDFVDANGKPVPAWEAYFTAIWANQNKDAKVGQFTASNLSNFHDTVNHYAQQTAALTGLPMRYFGQNTANPPSADGIRADESRLVKDAEDKEVHLSDNLGRVFALYLRIRDGEWRDDGSRIRAEWHDPGTPTVAARADAAVKLYQADAISRQGLWDELGWSEPRKEREREYLADEQLDPIAKQILRDINDADAAELGS